jgi:predicted DNA-binding transcriptional regulator
MNKLELLGELEKLVNRKCLDADEIRLYLLLLTNCGGSRNGEIKFSTIRSAMGEDYSWEKLKNACQRLFSNKLIVVTSLFTEGEKEENIILAYMILPASVNS